MCFRFNGVCQGIADRHTEAKLSNKPGPRHLPQATIYVYDNNSSDRTVEVATQAGVIVRKETQQGKGNVVRRMFSDVDADVYVLVDGDDTYDAAAAPALVSKLRDEKLDIVSGALKLPNCGSIFCAQYRLALPTRSLPWALCLCLLPPS